MRMRADAAFRLVIVLDGPPDAESLAAVEELRAAARREVGGFELSVLAHETPLGFLRSANRALRESARDAVLLNSDTQVTAGWLGRLRAAAYSDAKIATVTPFSNNATICSLPRFLDENAIPAGYTIDSFGALVTRVSRREYPRLPTGVGFCLYVKRSVLDEIGLFDEAFGLGYGEEVDLCLRAASRGYVHVLDDATFIFHEGSRSFGRSREQSHPARRAPGAVAISGLPQGRCGVHQEGPDRARARAGARRTATLRGWAGKGRAPSERS